MRRLWIIKFKFRYTAKFSITKCPLCSSIVTHSSSNKPPAEARSFRKHFVPHIKSGSCSSSYYVFIASSENNMNLIAASSENSRLWHQLQVIACEVTDLMIAVACMWKFRPRPPCNLINIMASANRKSHRILLCVCGEDESSRSARLYSLHLNYYYHDY